MPHAVAIAKTWLKQSTEDSRTLGDADKVQISQGQAIAYTKCTTKDANHFELTLASPMKEKTTWLAFKKHFDWPRKPSDELISMATATHIFGRSPSSAQLTDLNSCLSRFAINTPPRMRHFLSQVGHESGGLQWLKEIDQGWYIPRNFDLPEIAGSDGGYKYRGAGVIQLSLPENYLAFSKFMGDSKIYDEGCPYVAAVYPFSSAGFWWQNNNMNALCDRGASVEEVTLRVNGAYNGLDDRVYYYNRACDVI